MLTQVENELEGYAFGQERMAKNIAKNEEKGHADSNPYAQAVYRRFVLPLAAIIRDDLSAKRPGRRQAHVALMQDMAPDATAFVAVRAAMLNLMTAKIGDSTGRGVVDAVGKAVYHEHLLTNFSELHPELFYTLTQDFDRKQSSDERHRMTVFKQQAKKSNIELPEWSRGDKDQVGAYLVEQMTKLGFLTMEQRQERSGNHIRSVLCANLHPDVRALIDQITDFVTESTPYFLPCVEPPKDWTAWNDGGFHTPEMRRLMPYVVKTHGSLRHIMREADLSKELEAVNHLQRTPWRINVRMLEAIRRIHENFDMEEIVSAQDLPRPEKPAWLSPGMKSEDVPEALQTEFKQWKRSMAEWYTEAKLRGTKWGRFYNAMRVAQKYKDYQALYFVYFMDFRGRKYVQTTGVSPQGSDMQKALLEFGEGKPLLTQAAKDWFCITGANRWGYDKATLPDRVKWVKDHHEQLLAFAADPVANSDWTKADKPLQFLAWCFEYADWIAFGDAFRSRVSVGMDGSCNGLQNFSAMLRDEVGGKATNLVPGLLPNDIYQMVADVAQAALELADDDEHGFRRKWLAHGLNRTLVKRSVMTLPYGSTRMSCTDFIVTDYLNAGKAKEFDRKEYKRAAAFLSGFVWAAIGEVVVKAREAMQWLQRGATALVKAGHQHINWITPTGFPVLQVYWTQETHQINTRLCGQARLKVYTDGDDPDRNRHKNGIAPNFVHALDASHLTLTTLACKARGIAALHMVHDDFGTHAADAEALYEAIREEFVGMYERGCPLADFHERYPDLPERPSLGELDIRQVLDSPFFFS